MCIWGRGVWVKGCGETGWIGRECRRRRQSAPGTCRWVNVHIFFFCPVLQVKWSAWVLAEVKKLLCDWLSAATRHIQCEHHTRIDISTLEFKGAKCDGSSVSYSPTAVQQPSKQISESYCCTRWRVPSLSWTHAVGFWLSPLDAGLLLPKIDICFFYRVTRLITTTKLCLISAWG